VTGHAVCARDVSGRQVDPWTVTYVKAIQANDVSYYSIVVPFRRS
jgi:hypothetical protein